MQQAVFGRLLLALPRLACWAGLPVKTHAGSVSHRWDPFPRGAPSSRKEKPRQWGRSRLLGSKAAGCGPPCSGGGCLRTSPARIWGPWGAGLVPALRPSRLGPLLDYSAHGTTAHTSIHPCHSRTRIPLVPSSPPFLWEFVFRARGGTIHRSMLLGFQHIMWPLAEQIASQCPYVTKQHRRSDVPDVSAQQ